MSDYDYDGEKAKKNEKVIMSWTKFKDASMQAILDLLEEHCVIFIVRKDGIPLKLTKADLS